MTSTMGGARVLTLLIAVSLFLPASQLRAQSPFGLDLCDGAITSPPKALVGFSSEDIHSPGAFDGIIGGLDADGELVVRAPRGGAAGATVYANIIAWHPGEDLRLDGWDLPIELIGPAHPTSVSYRTTSAFRYFDGGFERTVILDSALNGGRNGFFSVVVPSFQCFDCPTSSGTYSVLEMQFELDAPQAEDEVAAELRFSDGLRIVEGRELTAQVCMEGELVRPCNVGKAAVTIRFRPGPAFRRGDANGDTAVDISDAVAILAALFLGEVEMPCEDALDVTNDGRIDVSDAVALLGYLFLGSSPPPRPFPACGVDASSGDDDDGLNCRSEACAGP